nr:MAG TPA: portal protein [Caudoviricetes sp.]
MMKEELIQKTNECIQDLVYDKWELQKAYNYYEGFRDKRQYEYLEKNFGIGNPTSVSFTPLVKKHIDALVGEFLGTPILPKISCKDTDTISNINREKQLEIDNNIVKFLKNHLTNSLLSFVNGKDITDKAIKDQLDKVIEEIDQNYISKYEIAAQNVVQYVMQSRETDMITKHKQLLLDVLISGTPFFRVTETPSKENIEIEVLDPLNTFIDRNPNSIYVKDSYRVVVRKWMSKSQILNLYGKDLTEDDITTLRSYWNQHGTGSHYVSVGGNCQSTGCEGGVKVSSENLPGYPKRTEGGINTNLLPVYEVEWLETDKDHVMYRYSSVRIDEGIYILNGKDEHSTRTRNNPNYTCLKTNGVHFWNHSNAPFSLMQACIPIQDKYDLLLYYRDNLIASSGGVGDWIDLSLIPKNLGANFPEAIQKWLAYKKNGIGLLDTTQEGRNNNGNSPMNTIFNGFDNTVKQASVAAIQTAIDSLEYTLSSITGVFRERLNGIEQKDAVTNIKQGVTNSFIITKQYYQQMDLLTCEILTDCLNQAKVTWKYGLTGILVLGDQQQKIFTALPEEFTVSDYDIHVISTTQILEEIQQMWGIIPELIKAGQLSPDILFEVMASKSLSEIKMKVRKAVEKQKKENDMIQKLNQKLEEVSQQAQQLQSELQKAQKELQDNDQKRFELEQQKLQLDNKLKWFQAETERKYREAQTNLATKRTEIEILQVRDGNPYNDQIKHTGLTSLNS